MLNLFDNNRLLIPVLTVYDCMHAQKCNFPYFCFKAVIKSFLLFFITKFRSYASTQDVVPQFKTTNDLMNKAREILELTSVKE